MTFWVSNASLLCPHELTAPPSFQAQTALSTDAFLEGDQAVYETWGISVSSPCGGGGRDRVSWMPHLLISPVTAMALGRVCSSCCDLTCFIVAPCVRPGLVSHKDGQATTKKAEDVPEKF